jgi:hypothetical protein
MAPAIFLSYVEEDSATVLPLARELRRLDHSTWTFEENGRGGRSYLEAVHDAVCSCSTFLLMASAASVRSHQVLREIELAHGEGRPIVPVLIDLTMEQLRSAHPIIKVAIGTTTPFHASGSGSRELATRIHEGLGERVGTGRHAEASAASDVVKDIIAKFASARLEPIPEPVYEERTCLSCGGLGKKASVQKPGKWNTCKHCGGTGRVKFTKPRRPFSFEDL